MGQLREVGRGFAPTSSPTVRSVSILLLFSLSFCRNTLGLHVWFERGSPWRCSSRYILQEKKRGAALDPVTNFHVRNGAVSFTLTVFNVFFYQTSLWQ